MLGDGWVDLGRPHIGSVDIRCITSLGDGIVLIGSLCPLGNAGHRFKSTNLGLSWVDKGPMPSNTAEEYVEVLANCGDGIVSAGMAAGAGQVSQSSNYGGSFAWIKELSVWQTKILSGVYLGIYLGNNIVLMGTGTTWIRAPQVFRSLDKGSTWDAGQGVGNFPASAISLLNLGGGVVLCGLSDATITRSTDYGASWTPAVHDFGGGAARGIQRMLKISDVVYALLRNGEVSRSANQGSNWTLVGSTGTTQVTDFTYVPELDLMFVGVSGLGFSGHIYRSENKGATWTDLGVVSAAFGIIRTIEYIHGADEYILLAGDGGAILADIAHIFRASEAIPSTIPPDDLHCEQKKNPTDVTDPQPEFSAIYRYE